VVVKFVVVKERRAISALMPQGLKRLRKKADVQGKIPSAAKAALQNEVYTARLKPRPFKTTTFSAASEALFSLCRVQRPKTEALGYLEAIRGSICRSSRSYISLVFPEAMALLRCGGEA
jgi:hypothetical protein